ncbi:MAG: hypothetical protein LBH26_03270 [Treponema sp.]|jgi:hypothetical protein|nr:hypothetical protein [Treponema sp.]
MRRVFLVILVLCAAGSLFPQADKPLQELNDILKNGQAALTARGNGGSSGMVINGYLRNTTSAEIWLDTFINRGIYLINSGAGQNMLATRIYLRGGQYYSDGSREFIILPAREDVEVSFIAFCANLERSNPSSEESFSSDAMPAELQAMAAKINRYMDEHPSGENQSTVAQLALWRSQGKTRNEIGEHFRFTQSDWDSAGLILAY